jgi:hypothetical protein
MPKVDRRVGTASTVAKSLLLLGLALFHVHNFLFYDPAWGYDGLPHILLVRLHSASAEFDPLAIYGGTNPPLYYLLAGKILSATNSLKAVQAFSLLLFASNLIVIWIALRRVCRHSPLRWPLLLFFALNPLHLAYAYMIFNYSLAQSIAITFVSMLLILAMRDGRPPPKLVAPGLGLAAAAGVWTSLTNLALLPIGAAFLFLHPSIPRRTRRLQTLVFLVVGLAAIAPYAVLRNVEQGCFLCTAHRPATTRPFYEVYPARYYYWVSLKPFHQPHVPHFWKDGMWPVLYQTYFGDYFNYVVGPRYALSGQGPALTKVIPHSTDTLRNGELTLLEYLGLPLAAALVAGLAISVRNSYRYLKTERPELFVDLIVCVSSMAYFIQFLAYIHRYPAYVNIHAGYLFPITAPLWVQVAYRLAPGPGVSLYGRILVAALVLYSTLAAATFFLR